MFYLSHKKKSTETADSATNMAQSDTDTVKPAGQDTAAPEDTFSRFVVPLLVSVLFFLLARIFYVSSFPAFLLSEDKKFERFTEDIFRSEMNSNTLNRNYTVADPASYHLDTDTVTLGDASPGARKESCASAENYLSSLQKFDYEKL